MRLPSQLIKKIARVLINKLRGEIRRVEVKVSGTEISDEAFLSALLRDYISIHDFLADFRGRKSPEFFLNLTYKNLESEREAVVKHADKICNHIFDLLGSGDKNLGEKIDWHTDFKLVPSGARELQRWNPKEYYKDVKIVRGDGSDIKVPWELSRFQHVAMLGRAYQLTSDEKYAKEFVAQINDWIDSNPVYFGVNWSCTMDVAIRATNWVMGYYLFKDSKTLSDEFLVKFLKAILVHGRFIRSNLEWSEDLTSNHYLSNITGLVYLGIMFPEFKEASEWKEFGVKELVSEMEKQVYEDGADFEASISYHRLVLELFFYPALQCKINNIELPEKFWNKLKKMFEFVQYYLKPNGLAPQIGDNDNGRLHIFEERDVNDHSYLLTLGSLLFPNLELRTPSELNSKAFKDAGIYIMRDANAYMIISCGPNGQKGNGGHCHNDKLSFEININDEDLIIDPGTFLYTPEPEWRNKFRSTAYHNTIMIDGEEQNRFKKGKLFTLENDSQAKCIKWETSEDYDLFIGEHYGYNRPPLLASPRHGGRKKVGGVIHQREIRFDKKGKLWQIKDRLEGEGEHHIECFYHFPASVNVKQISDLEFLITGGMVEVSLKLNPDSKSEIRNSKSKIENGWVSPSYGIKIPAPFVRFYFRTPLPIELNFEILVVGEAKLCQEIHQ